MLFVGLILGFILGALAMNFYVEYLEDKVRGYKDTVEDLKNANLKLTKENIKLQGGKKNV